MNAFRTLSAPLLLALAAPAPCADDPQPWLQYATPEQAGWSSEGLAAARATAESIDSAAVFAVVGGHVLVAWGATERRFKCHSVRKSLLSALYGIHVAEGAIDLEASLAELEIDDREALSEGEQSARVIDLLRARSGVYHQAAKETPQMRQQRPARDSHEPGTHWWYNNWDFNTLLTIFEQESGTKVFDEFERRIARPVGMQDYRPQDGYYQLEPSRSRHAAYAFRMSARDLARFGWMFARGGTWNGAEIVPPDWVLESTDAHSPAREGGYGYMWWAYPAGSSGLSAYPVLDRFDKFAARGTGGQFLLVVPEADFVFVHRGDTDNDRRVEGSGIWRMAEQLLAARVGAPAAEPELVPVVQVPFENPGPMPVERIAIELEPAQLEAFVGEYLGVTDERMRVFVHDGRLFLTASRGELELFPESATSFFARATPLTAEFDLGQDGLAGHVQVQFGSGTRRLARAR